jgi:hypothetical protein
MKRYSGTLVAMAFGGCVGLVAAGGALAQSNSEQTGQRRQTSSTSSSSSSGGSRADNRAPLPDPQRVPLPAGGGRTPLGGSGGLPDVPSGADRRRNAPPPAREETSEEDVAPDGPYNAIKHANDLEDAARRRHGLGTSDNYDPNRAGRQGYGYGRGGGYRQPGYSDYNPWRYDNYRRYNDGYRPYEDPYRYNPPPTPQRDYGYGYGGEVPVTTQPPTDAAPGVGALLPPDGLMDEDLPPALRKAVDASPQYREAMAQLLRAWAEYARAADTVLSRLRNNPAYQKALAELRDAEAKVANLRDRGGNVPAVNLVTAAQQAMLARRAVRAQEERAIDADPTARKAKEQLGQAVERRDKVRDEIAAKLPPDQKAEPAR